MGLTASPEGTFCGPSLSSLLSEEATDADNPISHRELTGGLSFEVGSCDVHLVGVPLATLASVWLQPTLIGASLPSAFVVFLHPRMRRLGAACWSADPV